MLDLSAVNIPAQIFGLFGMAMLFVSYQQSRRERLIAFKLGADVMWVTHYLLLGASGGAIPNFVGIFRELVFMRRGRKWADSPLWPVLFICANWALAIYTWKSLLTLLPICASTLVTISLWVKNPTLTRIICVPVSVSFLIYDVFAGSLTGIVNESAALVSIASSILRNDIKKTGVSREKHNNTDKI